MSRLLLLALLLVVTGLLCWPGSVAVAPAPDGKATVPAAAPAVSGEVAAPASSPVRVEAREASDTPPFPVDGTWIDVHIVDAATQQPVAGAEVTWMDSSMTKLAAAAAGDEEEDKQRARHDDETTAARFGWHATSDAAGQVHVNRTAFTRVFARKGTTFGKLELNGSAGPPPEGFRIEMTVDRELRTVVLDAAGVPVGGQSVYAWAARGAYRVGPNLTIVRSQPDGRATLRHVQLLDHSKANADVDWRVGVLLNGYADPGVAFDPAAPPVEPIVLHLPPCGRVMVRTLLGGMLLHPHAPVELRPADPAEQWREMMIHSESGMAGDDGWTRFRRVAAGGTYSLFQRLQQVDLAHEFTGPAEGEELAIDLLMPEDSVILAGRLLDDHGELLRATGLQAVDFHTMDAERDIDKNTGGSFITDKQGRFLFCLGKSRPGLTLKKFVVPWQRGEIELRASLAPRPLFAGVQDIGDLVLASK
jgi:hypothetical protein